jgi:hypothetical protein
LLGLIVIVADYGSHSYSLASPALALRATVWFASFVKGNCFFEARGGESNY